MLGRCSTNRAPVPVLYYLQNSSTVWYIVPRWVFFVYLIRAWPLFHLLVFLICIEFHCYYYCYSCHYHYYDWDRFFLCTGSLQIHYVARLFLCSCSSCLCFPWCWDFHLYLPGVFFFFHGISQDFLCLYQCCYVCPMVGLILQPRDGPELCPCGFHSNECKGEWRNMQVRHWGIKVNRSKCSCL